MLPIRLSGAVNGYGAAGPSSSTLNDSCGSGNMPGSRRRFHAVSVRQSAIAEGASGWASTSSWRVVSIASVTRHGAVGLTAATHADVSIRRRKSTLRRGVMAPPPNP